MIFKILEAKRQNPKANKALLREKKGQVALNRFYHLVVLRIRENRSIMQVGV